MSGPGAAGSAAGAPNAPHIRTSFLSDGGAVLIAQNIGLAGLSNACGQTTSHPFDLLKTRFQIQGAGTRAAGSRQYNGLIGGLRTIYQNEGILGWYKGWRAAVYRELSYSGMRVGLYEPFKEVFGARDPKHTPLYKKVAAGMCSGSLAAAINTPLDIMKVRFMSAATQEQYKQLGSPAKALYDVWKVEGPGRLYRGIVPNTARGALLTATQVPAYDHIKHTILNNKLMNEGRPLHFVSSVAAGFIAVMCTNPIDVVKTRLMNMRTTGGAPSMGTLGCLTNIVTNEGPLALYKGSMTAWLRLGPHTIVTFLIFEQLRKTFNVRPL